jgi:pSer/pThr/pTyr-binding forkhead associated (FHA) protein
MTGILVFILRIFLAVALTAFVGWAFFTLWRDMRLQIQLLNSRKVPTLTITLEDEPGTSFQFTKAEVSVGRDPTSDLILADSTAPGKHARLSYHHNQWWVEDLQSTNGTYLNEERVYTGTVIITGDMLRFGQTVAHVGILNS